MITRVYGSCNEFNIEFQRREGSDQEIWDAIVPASEDGTFVVEIYVDSSSGMSTYVATVMFVISGHKLKGMLVPRGYAGGSENITFESLLDVGQLMTELFTRCYEGQQVC